VPRDVPASKPSVAPGRRRGAHVHRLPAVALFSRSPLAGRAKTRLIPTLGPAGAARFQSALIRDSLAKLDRLRNRARPFLFLSGAGGASPNSRAWTFGLEIPVLRQQGKDLGARLAHALRQLLRHHPGAVVIGADAPELEPRTIRLALSELESCDAVLGPCPDGGYYLIGVRRGETAPHLPRGLFRGVRWGSRHALRDTLENLLALGWVVSVLDPCPDVDRPGDFTRLARRFKRSARLRRLSPAVWRFVSALDTERRTRR